MWWLMLMWLIMGAGFTACIQCGRSNRSSRTTSAKFTKEDSSSRRVVKRAKRPTIDSHNDEEGDEAAADRQRTSMKPLRQMDQESELSRSLLSSPTNQ
ncbi:unnamed protein product [Bursaphelenchus okinawaensis]|uniref:Secreted protein n=1 Tax=Bursaphelenchus okinawaensis TaxID=465554 RepID=A0A811JWT3_9BILA|nr:unnamed protein product [Bursaphelenchus okinawaensis]CAG9085894.1 unnamed protein product [Bursaphelenchus okinawaensis]